MPFTLFHLGPALFLGLLLFWYLDFPTFVLANVIVDIRAALIFLGPWQGSLHGPLQTFLGGTVLGLLLGAVVHRYRGRVNDLLAPFRLSHDYSLGQAVLAGVAGTWLHVLLDSFLWADMQPFYPFPGNPFLGTVGFDAVHGFTIATAVLAAPLYLYMVRTGRLPEPV